MKQLKNQPAKRFSESARAQSRKTQSEHHPRVVMKVFRGPADPAALGTSGARRDEVFIPFCIAVPLWARGSELLPVGRLLCFSRPFCPFSAPLCPPGSNHCGNPHLV